MYADESHGAWIETLEELYALIHWLKEELLEAGMWQDDMTWGYWTGGRVYYGGSNLWHDGR